MNESTPIEQALADETRKWTTGEGTDLARTAGEPLIEVSRDPVVRVAATLPQNPPTGRIDRTWPMPGEPTPPGL